LEVEWSNPWLLSRQLYSGDVALLKRGWAHCGSELTPFLECLRQLPGEGEIYPRLSTWLEEQVFQGTRNRPLPAGVETPARGQP
ncbi:MAG: hypothetical protein V3T77_01720, partial [Planctomycetota bacterium]